MLHSSAMHHIISSASWLKRTSKQQNRKITDLKLSWQIDITFFDVLLLYIWPVILAGNAISSVLLKESAWKRCHVGKNCSVQASLVEIWLFFMVEMLSPSYIPVYLLWLCQLSWLSRASWSRSQAVQIFFEWKFIFELLNPLWERTILKAFHYSLLLATFAQSVQEEKEEKHKTSAPCSQITGMHNHVKIDFLFNQLRGKSPVVSHYSFEYMFAYVCTACVSYANRIQACVVYHGHNV